MSLSGQTVAVAGSRKPDEFTRLIEKHGGRAIHRPMQKTVFQDSQELKGTVVSAVENGTDWFIFTTGMGTEYLFKRVLNTDIGSEFLYQLHQANIAVRGYKTAQVLKRYGLKPDVRDDKGTIAGLARALHAFDFKRKNVFIQLHGEQTPGLTDPLEQEGAECLTVLPYRHVPPNQTTSEQLTEEILSRKVHAVCFTSSLQVRFFFEYLKSTDRLSSVIKAFENEVCATAVGTVTEEALTQEGIRFVLSPAKQRMGAMIVALSEHFENLKQAAE